MSQADLFFVTYRGGGRTNKLFFFPRVKTFLTQGNVGGGCGVEVDIVEEGNKF